MKEAILMLMLAAVSVFGIIGWLLFLVKCSTSKWDYLDLGRQLAETRAKLAETEAARLPFRPEGVDEAGALAWAQKIGWDKTCERMAAPTRFR